MNSKYLENPLNRRKGKYKFYLRHFENLLKNIFIYAFLLPIIFPILILNYYKKNKFLFTDFFNQNAVVFIVSCLAKKGNSVFIFKILDFHKVLSRFGIKFLLKNFSIYIGFDDLKKISFIDNKADYFLNKDYFYFFDNKLSEKNNNFVLPFYLTKNFYIPNKIDKLKSLIKPEKKFKIIFSGSSHREWYAENNFKNSENEDILNRPEILDIIKSNFSEKLVLIKNFDELKQIEFENKEILIIETNPEVTKRKKIIPQYQNLELISNSNFFLCMPGASMPLCYHLIESCLVGTVPILSYNNYLHPKFTKEEALFFSNERDLIEAVNYALNMDNQTYLNMQNKIIKYYDKFLSTSGVYNSISKKELPLEIFINVDHTSSFLRKKRNKIN